MITKHVVVLPYDEQWEQEGAALYPYDIDRYIEYKSQFIENLYREIYKNRNTLISSTSSEPQ